MKTSIFVHIRALVVLLLLSNFCHAQKVRFVAEELPEGGPEVELVVNKKNSDTFRLQLNSLTEMHRVKGRAFSIVSAANQETLAQVKLPSKGSEFVVLFLKAHEVEGQKPAHPFKGVAILDSKRAFKAGQFYLFNNTPHPITCNLDDKEQAVPPHTGQLVAPKPKRDQTAYQVEIKSTQDDGTQIPVSNSRWPVSKAIRRYIILSYSSEDKRTSLRSIDEPVED